MELGECVGRSGAEREAKFVGDGLKVVDPLERAAFFSGYGGKKLKNLI